MKKILLLIFICASLAAQAQVKVTMIQTASSRFRQTRTSMMLEKPEIRQGSFRFIAPDSICWKYDGLDNVRLPEQMLGFIRQAVSGDMAAAEGSFNISWKDKTMILTPIKKQIKRFFTNIHIVFNDKGVAREVRLIEPSGDETLIEFINLQYTTNQ